MLVLVMALLGPALLRKMHVEIHNNQHGSYMFDMMFYQGPFINMVELRLANE